MGNNMPFSLFVREYRSAYGDFYDNKGKRVIDTRHNPMEIDKVQPYSEELFLKCQNISRREDVYELIREYPTLCLFNNDERCLNLLHYASKVNSIIRDCHSFLKVEEALKTYNRCKNYSAASELFKRYLETGYVRRTMDNPQARIFESIVYSEEQFTAHIGQISNYIDGIKITIDNHSKLMTSGSTITFNPDNSEMTCLCDSLISAMYFQQYVNVFNNRIYRQCAHKGCNRWFLVDSHHPQSRCDEHMEPRRRKRQQYKKAIRL